MSETRVDPGTGATLVPVDHDPFTEPEPPGYFNKIGQDLADFWQQPIEHVRQRLSDIGQSFVSAAQSGLPRQADVLSADYSNQPVRTTSQRWPSRGSKETEPPWMLRGEAVISRRSTRATGWKAARTRPSLPMKLSQSWPAYAAIRDVTVRRLLTVTIPLRARGGSLPYVMVCPTSIS
jgi:hypothetical protein